MKRLFLVLMIAIIPATAVARQNASRKTADEETLSVNVDLVNVIFTVADKKGKFIPDLNRQQFKVYEDGKPQSITNFSADSNLPLTIAFLVDTSGSVRDRLRFEQEAAIEFFYSTLRRGKDRARHHFRFGS
jgi:Ca-activated chloride channel homolog